MNHLSPHIRRATVRRSAVLGPADIGDRRSTRDQASPSLHVREPERAPQRRICALCGRPIVGGQRITRIHGSAVHVACRSLS